MDCWPLPMLFLNGVLQKNNSPQIMRLMGDSLNSLPMRRTMMSDAIIPSAAQAAVALAYSSKAKGVNKTYRPCA